MSLRDVLRENRLLMQLYSMLRDSIGHVNDRYYGIKTESVDSFRFRNVCTDATRYEAIPYWLLKRIVEVVRPGPEDVFFDIGCGKGRALAMFALCPIKKCVGVEIDPSLAQVAERNAAGLRGRVAPIEVRTENAAETDYGSGTIYFMFNPFGPATLTAVLTRIQESLVKRPRKICVVYYNPLHREVVQSVLGLKATVRTEGHFPWRPQKVAFVANYPLGESRE
ncbi:MAG: class I SAM-dependent methyltransferase [Verrucomicrobia bacterium]|nr:class I SAM-dependent methyltransferase [Verrucomicrobiota bacterium]